MVYGKIFESLFTGSMFGCGPIRFAVWSYVIAHTKPSQTDDGQETGVVEINPPVLAAALGTTPADVEEAIAYLCQKDPRSRNPAHDGCRLVHVGSFIYEVPSFPIYQRKQNSDERKAAVRERVRAHRERKKGAGNGVVTLGNAGNDTQTQDSDAYVPSTNQSTPPPPKGGVPSRKREKPATVEKPDDVTEQTWADWVAHRKAKKALVTDGVIASVRKQLPAGWTIEQGLAFWVSSGNQGFYPPKDAATKQPTRYSAEQIGASLRNWMDKEDS